MSKVDIEKHKIAISAALKSEQPQKLAFTHLKNDVKQLLVLILGPSRPQAMKKQKHELSKKRSRSASNMETGVRKSKKRAIKVEKIGPPQGPS